MKVAGDDEDDEDEEEEEKEDVPDDSTGPMAANNTGNKTSPWKRPKVTVKEIT